MLRVAIRICPRLAVQWPRHAGGAVTGSPGCSGGARLWRASCARAATRGPFEVGSAVPRESIRVPLAPRRGLPGALLGVACGRGRREPVGARALARGPRREPAAPPQPLARPRADRLAERALDLDRDALASPPPPGAGRRGALA